MELESYLPIVKSVAASTHCSSNAIDFDDLCQVGLMAALRASERYKEDLGMSLESFIFKLVKQDIYRESGRFLKVFTVDSRTTRLAAKAHALEKTDKSTLEISQECDIDCKKVKNLLYAYNLKRQHDIPEDTGDDCFADVIVNDILESVIYDSQEEYIMNHRITGNLSVREVSKELDISIPAVYDIEKSLRERIYKAIQE